MSYILLRCISLRLICASRKLYASKPRIVLIIPLRAKRMSDGQPDNASPSGVPSIALFYQSYNIIIVPKPSQYHLKSIFSSLFCIFFRKYISYCAWSAQIFQVRYRHFRPGILRHVLAAIFIDSSRIMLQKPIIIAVQHMTVNRHAVSAAN